MLHIALQEGFTGEAVSIIVNGQEVFRKSGVKTRLQSGYADAVEVPVPAGAVEVRIAVEARQPPMTLSLEVRQPLYVGVSLSAEGELTSRTAVEPFGYL
jgi:hypothetical protein